MIKVSIMYPNSDTAKFDDEYYFSHHFPMVAELLADDLKAAEFDIGVASIKDPVEDALFIMVSHLTFDSMNAFLHSFSQHAERISSDLEYFTNIQPQVQISEIVKFDKGSGILSHAK